MTDPDPAPLGSLWFRVSLVSVDDGALSVDLPVHVMPAANPVPVTEATVQSDAGWAPANRAALKARAAASDLFPAHHFAITNVELIPEPTPHEAGLVVVHIVPREED